MSSSTFSPVGGGGDGGGGSSMLDPLDPTVVEPLNSQEHPLKFDDIVDRKTYDKMRPPKPGGTGAVIDEGQRQIKRQRSSMLFRGDRIYLIP